MRTIGLFVVVVVVGSLAVPEARGDQPDSVKQVLATWIAAAANEEPGALEEALGESAFRRLSAERRTHAFAELRAALVDARIGSLEVGDTQATVAIAHGRRHKTKSQLVLAKRGRSWELSSPTIYTFESTDLQQRNGKKPVRVVLTVRKKNGAYGTSAYSFRYATRDALACKNRVDIWPSFNGDFHVRRNRIADIGKTRLSKVAGIPGGVSWQQMIPIKTGHTYVMHCLDRRDRDFYVKLHVVSANDDQVAFDWQLLTSGFGAPDNIHVPQKLVSNDGSDGTDGLPGRRSGK